MAASDKQRTADEIAAIIQTIYNTGLFPTKNEIEQWIKENVEKIFIDALSNTVNRDWEGTGNTYAGEMIEVLMGSNMTNGALSSYLLTKWFSERGPGYDAIQNIVAGDIGTARDNNHSDLNSILERNPSLLVYLQSRSESSTYLQNSSFNPSVEKTKCWIWLAKHAIEYRDNNIFGPSLKDMLFSTAKEEQNLIASVRKTIHTIDTDIECKPDSYEHAHIIIKCSNPLSSPVKVLVNNIGREEYPIVTAVANHYLIFVSCDFGTTGMLRIESENAIELVRVRII